MSYWKQFQDVLEQEGQAILATRSRIKPREVEKLLEIYKYLKASRGELIFCGVGKSGQIASKIASTFNSVGLKSSFLHPVEALHGDLGRMGPQDALVLISKSGTTSEIIQLIPYVSLSSKRIIGLLGHPRSQIAKLCHLVFDCSVEKEACINNQAPTTSSTVTLAIGDAMAVLWESLLGLSKEGFAANHPGGFLGKSLRLKVSHLMLPLNLCAILSPQSTLKDAILKMTEFPTGLCALEEGGVFKGILVEGDIRRALAKNHTLETPLQGLGSFSPILVGPDELAMDALRLMELREHPLNVLPVVGQGRKFLGVLRLHDLLKEGLSSHEEGASSDLAFE